MINLLPQLLPTMATTPKPYKTVNKNGSTTPPLVATYIEPLEQDLVVFTHPTPTGNRSGASGFELYKKLLLEYSEIDKKLQEPLKTLVENRQALSHWLQTNWENIPSTLEVLFTTPQPDALQGSAQAFLQQFPVLDKLSKNVTATKIDKAAPIEAITNFCNQIEQALYSGAVSQKLGNPSTFISTLVQNQVPIDAPYPLDQWKYHRVLFELAVANKLFDRVERYYDALKTSIKNASILYDGLKVKHPEILVDGGKYTTSKHPELYVPVYRNHSQEPNLINRYHKILNDFRAVPPNEEGWLSRVYADRLYLEPTEDEAGNFPTTTAALTYLKQAYIKKEEALAVKKVLDEIRIRMEQQLQSVNKLEESLLGLLRLDLESLREDKPEWQEAIKGSQNAFTLNTENGLVTTSPIILFPKLINKLKTQQTLRNYHNYLGYSSAFSEFGNLNKTQSLADIVLEGQTFITNAIELFSPMYGEEGLIPNQQCIELEQKIQATLNNIKDFVPLAIDILQDNQEHL